jgi:hypothetical protein
MTVPTLELYTHGLYTDETFLNAARAAFDDAGHDQKQGNPV